LRWAASNVAIMSGGAGPCNDGSRYGMVPARSSGTFCCSTTPWGPFLQTCALGMHSS
jgi:hypothetical protein